MLTDVQVALFFLSLDESGTLFNQNLMNRNGRRFYEGNARLNKYLHLAQNIYIAKTGTPLMDTTFYAYDNGAVVPEIQEYYNVLRKQKRTDPIPSDQEDFLRRFFVAFKDAPIDELIALSHEDSEWERKHHYYRKADQKMDTLANIEEYREQYKDIADVLDRMVI